MSSTPSLARAALASSEWTVISRRARSSADGGEPFFAPVVLVEARHNRRICDSAKLRCRRAINGLGPIVPTEWRRHSPLIHSEHSDAFFDVRRGADGRGRHALRHRRACPRTSGAAARATPLDRRLKQGLVSFGLAPSEPVSLANRGGVFCRQIKESDANSNG